MIKHKKYNPKGIVYILVCMLKLKFVRIKCYYFLDIRQLKCF